MKKRYCIEVSLERITPIIVEADSENEAVELVCNQQGSPGDAYDGECKVKKVHCLDGSL